MNPFKSLFNLFAASLDVVRVQVHVAVALLKHPTLRIQRPSIWRYDSIHSLQIGKDVSVGPYTEIIAYGRNKKSSVPGKLILHDRSKLSAGCNVRAAGGTIE